MPPAMEAGLLLPMTTRLGARILGTVDNEHSPSEGPRQR